MGGEIIRRLGHGVLAAASTPNGTAGRPLISSSRSSCSSSARQSARRTTAAVSTILRRGAIIWGLGFPRRVSVLRSLHRSHHRGARAHRVVLRADRVTRARGRVSSAPAPHGAHDRRRVAVAVLDLARCRPFPRVRGDLSPEGNIGAWLNRTIFGAHVWRGGQWDPEGLLSTVPAIATTMIGLIAGWFMRRVHGPGLPLGASPARSCAGC